MIALPPHLVSPEPAPVHRTPLCRVIDELAKSKAPQKQLIEAAVAIGTEMYTYPGDVMAWRYEKSSPPPPGKESWPLIDGSLFLFIRYNKGWNKFFTQHYTIIKKSGAYRIYVRKK